MIISLKWISDFVDLGEELAQPEKLAKILTDAGLEVEGMEDQGKNFNHVVVGQIIEKGQHPDADRLTLCQVDVGDKALKQIVCGAKNHNKGDKVVVALPGAVLPGDFQIKLSKIRGIESSGMLASESELGLSKESEGILILPSDAKVGTPFSEYSDKSDVTLDLNVTPNRADGLSHFGLAREISALLNRPLKEKVIDLQAKAEISVKKEIQLRVEDSETCPRYMARYIKGVKVGESPPWLKNRLESVGMNSINNVVDITNYVMMELGQPLHAFDADQLKGSQVIVAKAKAGENFVTLDGTSLKLQGDELTIRDSESAVCLAGVVGGENSGVSEATKNIFLEAAHFSMESVRRTSRKFGLQTDSAYRFSRGTDVSMVKRALDLASSLLASECGGAVSGDHYDLYPKEKKNPEILVRYSYVAERLGYPVDSNEFLDFMKRLGLSVLKSGEKEALLRAPSHRVDIEQEVDLVEEFGRMKGYDQIPEILPSMDSEPLPHDSRWILENALVESMTSLGYLQSVNYGFTSEKSLMDLFSDGSSLRDEKISYPKSTVKLRNPLSEELNAMRTSLVPGLLENFYFNVRHGNKVGRLFELGSRFSQSEEGGKTSYVEDSMLGLLAWGNGESLWKPKEPPPLFFEVKSTLERLFQKFRLGGVNGQLFEPLFGSLEFRAYENVPSFLHPGQSATLFCEGKVIGYVGSLHPNLMSEAKMKDSAVVAEMEVSAFQRSLGRKLNAKTPSKYPSVERDIAFIAPKDQSALSIIQVIKKVAGNYLQGVTVTDEFMGGDLGEGNKSVSFRMTLQDETGTLKDEQLLEIQNKIISSAEKKLGVKLR